MPSLEKLARLARLESQPPPHGGMEARHLLEAFRQDVVKRRYASWQELLAYCQCSANPVGRFLLRLHGEDPCLAPASDALCTALQILNHLQDLGEDRKCLDRIYLPLPWLEPAGGEEGFFEPVAVARRRPILDAVLDQVDAQLSLAASLPGRIASPRLAAQAQATLTCARCLSDRLRRHDPLQRRVELRRAEVAAIVATAALRRHRPASDEAETRRILQRSRSSFRLGIASLRGERRRAMRALYAFSRVVDDLADSAAPTAERRLFLGAWRAELDRLDTAPTTPIGRELAWASRRFALPRAELARLLDGMTVDAAPRVRLADEPALDGYCRAVAGSVGLLAIRIFGAEEASPFALRLARALQLVNILRDASEDAERDRVYLPQIWLNALGIPDGEASSITAHERFARAWTQLAETARGAFDGADQALAGLDRRPLRPALLMLASYRPLLERLCRQGWQPGRPRLRLGRVDKLRLTWLAWQDAT
jgi:phytoene synthase